MQWNNCIITTTTTTTAISSLLLPRFKYVLMYLLCNSTNFHKDHLTFSGLQDSAPVFCHFGFSCQLLLHSKCITSANTFPRTQSRLFSTDKWQSRVTMTWSTSKRPQGCNQDRDTHKEQISHQKHYSIEIERRSVKLYESKRNLASALAFPGYKYLLELCPPKRMMRLMGGIIWNGFITVIFLPSCRITATTTFFLFFISFFSPPFLYRQRLEINKRWRKKASKKGNIIGQALFSLFETLIP